MSAAIGPSEVAHYREMGYLVVADLLSPDELGTLRRVAEAWLEGARGVERHDDVYDLEPSHRPDSPRVRRIKDPMSHSAAYDAVMRKSELLDVVECLIGPDIRRQNTKLNMKDAEVGSPVGWHQDWAFYPHTNDDVLAVGIPLDDMTLDNGCLLVIPGSHLGPVLDHHAGGVFVGSVDPDGIDERAAVPLEVPAGSVTLHHARLLHGSAPNRSNGPRRLCLVEMVAGDAWPLLGGDWQALESAMLRGRLSPSPRLAAVPVRLPLPRPGGVETIYEFQAVAGDRRAPATPPAR
jgi:ectoine hydroxylase-related dioxygenase (phytanoyl-CoA dioxygenase family)